MALFTVLEAVVSPERTADLVAAYADAGRGPFPPGLVRSVLLRDSNDPARWRIETVWESLDALTAMRAAGTPRGILIFRAAGAEPTVSAFGVVAELEPPSGATG